MDKFNIKMDDGTEINTIAELGKELEELKKDINNIKYFLRNPNKYQQWD
tara:strand:+ start:215 stop:361 length:147 start_codon:yes stop_codon:yes gene_type:complete